MKRTLVIILIFTMLISSSALAIESENSIENTSFEYIWSGLKENGDLTVGDDGLLYISENNGFSNNQGYGEFLRIVNTLNGSIADGILAADAATVEVVTVFEIPEELLPACKEISADQICLPTAVPYNVGHGCSIPELSMLTICTNNYNTLVTYLNDMNAASAGNPAINPYNATVGFWIGKVAEGCEWDYKSSSAYKPWDKWWCTYIDGGYQHVTSEYFGNFNYGLTGSFLFTLDILHIGSLVVSGLNPKDVEDWPAIDSGYNHAP